MMSILLMSAASFAAFSLQMEAPLVAPRALECLDPVPQRLLDQFPRLFLDAFEAGTVSRAREEWVKEFGPQDYSAQQVAHGVGFAFKTSDTDPFDSERFQGQRTIPNWDSDPEAILQISKEVKAMRDTGRIVDVTAYKTDPKYVKFVLPIFAIRQGEKWRVVWDGRELNSEIHCDTFKMESAASTARLLEPGDYMFTIDMWSGYHQLKLQNGDGGDRADLRPYACFEWEGRTYQWQVLPFGLSTAPRSYQKIVLKLFGLWRARAWRCASYIDDGLWAAKTKEAAEAIRDQVLKDLERFGFIINKAKAHLVPAQAVKFLGFIFDTSAHAVRLFVPQEKMAKMQALAAGLVEEVKKADGRVKAVAVASLVGTVLSMRLALGPGRAYTRELLACLRQLPLVKRRAEDGAACWVRDYAQRVSISAGALLELRWLSERAHDFNGLEWLATSATKTLATDGSGQMWGFVTRAVEGANEGAIEAWGQGRHLVLDNDHSTYTELDALAQSLAQSPGLSGETVLHLTDSIATQCGLANGGYAVGEGSILNLLTKKILVICALRQIRLQSAYIGSDGIIRSGADFLSREKVEADAREDRTRLVAAAFERLVECFEAATGRTPVVDLFAEPGGNQGGLPFYSRRFLPELYGEDYWLGADALSEPWETCGYAFPPVPLIETVVEKAIRDADRYGAITLLVVPHWTQRPWMARLAQYDHLVLGPIAEVTETPAGARRPIESEATWRATELRAYIVGQDV